MCEFPFPQGEFFGAADFFQFFPRKVAIYVTKFPFLQYDAVRQGLKSRQSLKAVAKVYMHAQ